jgi:nitronate monooxygenase
MSSHKTFSMWYETRVTKLLGSTYPIMQGPFGGNLSTVQLAVTVSNAGGVGAYGCYTLTPAEMVKIDTEIRRATDKPYNLNLWVSNSDVPDGGITDAQFERVKELFRPYFEEVGLEFPEKPVTPPVRFEDQVQAVLDLRPPVFSFIFGIPSADILEQCRRNGIVTAGGATTADEAVALEAAGVDAVVATGFEAGGHRPSFLAAAEDSLTGTFVLLQQIRQRVRMPVIAAGGIGTGKGIAAALALGADGVQVGTAFLACEESGAPEFHRRLLLSPEHSKRTVLTRAFTGRLGRGLANRVAEELAGKEAALLPMPFQARFVSGLRQSAIAREKWEMLLLWSGQIAPVLKYHRAAELMRALIEEADAYFKACRSTS